MPYPKLAQSPKLPPGLQTYFAHLELGQESLTLRNYPAAVTAFTQAIKVQLQRFEAYYQHAEAYSFLQNNTAALTRLGSSPAVCTAAFARIQESLHPLVEGCSLNVSGLKPSQRQPTAYGLRGTIKREMQDISRAIQDFPQGLTIAQARKQFSLYKTLQQELKRTQQMPR